MVRPDHSQAIHTDHYSAKPKRFPWRLNTIRVTEDHKDGLEQLKDEQGWNEAECVRRGLDLLFKHHLGICRVRSRAI